MINRSSLTVMPAEVEQVICEYPGVIDVCIAGVPDTRRGEVPFAWLTLNGGALDSDAVPSWCREAMAPYKVTVGFQAVDRIPRSGIGKVLRHELVRSYQSGELTS